MSTIPDSVAAKIRVLEELKNKIVKGKVNFKKSPKERVTLSYCETRLEDLEQTWSKFESTHLEMVSEVEQNILAKTSYSKTNVFEVAEELFLDYKTELKETIGSLRPGRKEASASSQMLSAKPTRIKIPVANIPVFSGSYAQWPSFRDLFRSMIDNNQDLDEVQKLQYLKCHVSGEAEGLLRYLSITEDNYSIAWKRLESRYDNKKYLGNEILKKFLNLKSFTVESSNAIKLMLDSMDECLEALGKLGIDTSSWDLFVIHLLSEKLDPISRKEWESKASMSNEFDTIADFREFLEHKYKSLIYLDNKVKPRANIVKTVLHVSENTSSNNNNSCLCCKGAHKLSKCNEFKNEPLAKRRDFVKVHRLCFNCLGTNHSVFACRQSIRCSFCKRKHSSLLHSDGSTEVNSKGSEEVVNLVSAESSTLDKNDDFNDVISCTAAVRSQVLLATALVNIQSKSGSEDTLRCLLDQGSQASFITESAVQRLGLKKMRAQISISGIGSDDCTVASKSVVHLKLRSIYDSNYEIGVKVYVLSKLTTFLPRNKVAVHMWPELQKLELADPCFHVPNKIEILLGAEVYSQIILEGIRRGPSGCPVAQKTKLGWILSGVINASQSEIEEFVAHIGVNVSYSHEVSDDNLLRQFWEIEAEPSIKTSMPTEEEKKCEEIFEKTTRRDNEGRYIVRLPFRNEDPRCKYENLKDIAAKSLFRLERRLNKDADLKVQYSNGMDTYLDQNHMERVPESQRNKDTAVYLPHHPVIRSDKTTTKVRIVFNASQKGYNGVSLNDDLLCGPKLQPDLRHLIMRWRSYPICLSADIVKMYLQIKIAEEDTDFLRLLWRDKNGVLEHYRMTRVTFGTASAPYLAVKALQQLAIDEGEAYPLGSVRIMNDYYMDDLMSGCETVDEALQIYKEMNTLLKKGGFTLQKWISNSTEFLKEAGESQGIDKLEIGKEKDAESTRKVLGLNWESIADIFKYTVNLPEMFLPVTKRRVVSDISRLFDPLGFLAPVIITAKIFIQKLWIAGIDWDQELPVILLQEWVAYRNELKKLTGFKINRWIEMRSDDESVELQGFCDAFSEAYGAVVYARVIDRYGKVHVNLVASKTKVVPVKQISIPRLELCSAVLLAKLLEEVTNVLKVSKSQVHAWTDSTIVLAWLSSHPRKWNTFVANRVSEIISLFSRSYWSHVRTGENPADLASRGIKPSEFIENQLWKKGPKWLSEDKIIYSPLEKEEESKVVEIYETKEEMKLKCCSNITKEEESLFVKYSTLRKQVRVIAWCRRFIKFVHTKPKPTFPKWLTSTELEEARKLSIKYSQNHYFKEEIESLKNKKGISRSSKLKSFNPFLDADEILRIGGRLQNSKMSEAGKHPILISQHSNLAGLLIREAHERTLHGGSQLMLAHLRAKYWIINAKNLIKSYIRECLVCVRHNARASNPLMGQLPSARVTPSRPFKNSGVDFAGPISVRSSKGRGHHATKGYICLFICMCTRAIHLEMVSDLTSDAFIAAFKRFVSRRGHCAELWSDNGTNFVGAERELESFFTSERSNVAVDIQDWLATNGTKFHRIPPHSPHFGGLWEAGVKSTKHHLKRVIGTSMLTFEEMSTLLSQIEACLNSRPITLVDNDCNEPYPLTPGHFLVGEPLLLVPDASYKDSKITSLKRWQLTQKMVQDFWRRWQQEYLTRFLQRHKWQQSTSEPNVGDLVFIMENDLPPSRWLFGVIIEKHPGLDNVTRVVSIRCKGSNSIIKRPMSKICILPKTTEL